MLKYRDFCNLCAEQVLQAPPSGGDLMSRSNATGSSNFSKIIKELKAKHPGSKGRGGPHFVNRRGQSAGQKVTDNYATSKNIQQMVGAQPFVSTELHRFMTNVQDLPSGNAVHSPKHNRFDSIRDEEVYNSIGGHAATTSQTQSGWSRSGATSSNYNMTKLKAQLQNRTHGMTSEQYS